MTPNDSFDPELFKAIVEQMPEAVIFADRDGVIRLWNRGAESLFGFAAPDVIGQSLDVIIPERLREAHWAGYRRAIADGATQHGGQVRTTRSTHRDGRKLYVDLSFGIVKDAAGAVIGSTAVGRDATERFQADKAMRERVAALEAKLGSSASAGG